MLQRERKDSLLVFTFSSKILIWLCCFWKGRKGNVPNYPVKTHVRMYLVVVVCAVEKKNYMFVCLFVFCCSRCVQCLEISSQLSWLYWPLIFMARLNFPRKIYSGRQSHTITKKIYFSRHKRRERIIWIKAIILLISPVVFASFFATLASHADAPRTSSRVQEVKRTSAYKAITNVAIVVA